ncbi:MAG TPA: PEP-CTERM sorting domain-containing protein [Verrucomicrobiae bacterium]|nr:PEP-CTERM sorting domain-containing protein [Verrucomicrobiae bacterium]
MKKLLFLTALVAAAVGAQAQGTVAFNNHSTAVSAPVFDVGGSTLVSGPSIVAALFFNGVQQGDAAPFRTGNGAGYWNPGSDSTRVINGVAAGASATLEVRAWEVAKGATFDAAVAAGGKYGKSDPFTIAALGGQGPSGPPATPADMTGFKSFSLIPEPSTIALGALGAAALLLRRRK